MRKSHMSETGENVSPRWEYQFMRIYLSPVSGGSGDPGLNEAGEQGWEAVAVFGDATIGFFALLKRQKSADLR